MNNISTAVASPPEDVLQEILLRLDAKSITRFKLISKTLNEFISSPYFSKLYYKFRPSITAFFYKTSHYSYVEKNQTIQYVPLHPNQEPIVDPPACLGFLDHPAILVNSCNGLLHWHTLPNKHFILNPLNNKVVPIYLPFKKLFASGIAFDPSVSSDQFEVVALLFWKSRTSSWRLISKLFSSQTMKWGSIDETPITDFIEPFCPHRGVFINGILYWELKNSTLLAFSVKDRINWFIKLLITSGIVNKFNLVEPGCLGESNGKLHYARVLGTELIVFGQSSENSAIWPTLHRIDLNEGPSIKPGSIQALAFLDGFMGVLVSIKNKIKAYNLEDKSEKQVCEVRGIPFTHVLPSTFFAFVHTMALCNFQSV